MIASVWYLMKVTLFCPPTSHKWVCFLHFTNNRVFVQSADGQWSLSDEPELLSRWWRDTCGSFSVNCLFMSFASFSWHFLQDFYDFFLSWWTLLQMSCKYFLQFIWFYFVCLWWICWWWCTCFLSPYRNVLLVYRKMHRSCMAGGFDRVRKRLLTLSS